MSTPRLYTSLAAWWPVMSDPAEYAGEAAFFRKVLERHRTGTLRTVLELGSGGGNNASHLKAWYELTLTDLSDGMLEASRGLNPECEHVRGDMRTLRLDRAFDAVFVHDAIMYMTTEEDLRAAMATAFLHCRPGGVALLVPDVVKETWKPSTKHGGHDRGDRSFRYLEWDLDPDPDDTEFLTAFAFLMREGDGPVTCVHDEHRMGLFPRGTWTRLLEDVGFAPAVEVEPDHGRDLFVGHRPG